MQDAENCKFNKRFFPYFACDKRALSIKASTAHMYKIWSGGFESAGDCPKKENTFLWHHLIGEIQGK